MILSCQLHYHRQRCWGKTSSRCDSSKFDNSFLLILSFKQLKANSQTWTFLFKKFLYFSLSPDFFRGKGRTYLHKKRKKKLNSNIQKFKIFHSQKINVINRFCWSEKRVKSVSRLAGAHSRFARVQSSAAKNRMKEATRNYTICCLEISHIFHSKKNEQLPFSNH